MVEYIAGVIATAVMTMMILFGDKMGLMPPRSEYRLIVDGLGGKINDMMGLPKNMAWVVHILIGVVVHPLLIDVLALSDILGIVYALVFGVMMVLMLGFLGAPEAWKSKMTMGILGAHLVYGLLFVIIPTLL